MTYVTKYTSFPWSSFQFKIFFVKYVNPFQHECYVCLGNQTKQKKRKQVMHALVVNIFFLKQNLIVLNVKITFPIASSL